MWRIALKSMLADRGKLLTSLSGVAFAVVLANLQFGLLLGLLQKSSTLIDNGQADIWVGPRHMNNVDMGRHIPERWVDRVRSVDGVQAADPFLVAGSHATLPDGSSELVLVVGSRPASLLGGPHRLVEGDVRALSDPDAVVVDAFDAIKLGNVRVGEFREINGRRAKVVGLTTGYVGFTNNAYVFTTIERARSKYSVDTPPGQCSYCLVKARPGTDIPALCARIQQRVPCASVYDRQGYARQCMWFWLTRTGIGLSFGAATALGLLVGLAVVAQSLYASVMERIKEFATLKAIGADNRSTAKFLLAQALGNAALGSVVGLLAAVASSLAMQSPEAPVVLTATGMFVSVALVTTVCLVAAWLPYWRVCRIDPASVLRG